MNGLIEELKWPVAVIVSSIIWAIAGVSCVNSTDRKWENYSTACVQNGGELIQGQCIR